MTKTTISNFHLLNVNVKAKTLAAILSLVFSLASSLALPSLVLTASVGLSAFFTPTAFAHQQKMAITTVFFNPRTQNLEVMHRFDLHDAEHAVKEIFDGDADIMNSSNTQSEFAQYVVERFTIFKMDKTELPLSLVGTELEGKHFWVYQESPAPEQLDGLYIQHNALRDIWQQQTNTINIEGKGNIQTLTFTDNTELLSVEFLHK